MGHIVSKAAMQLKFLRTTISRLYRRYQISGKMSNLRRGRKKTLRDLDSRRLTRIFKRLTRATLPQFACGFKNWSINIDKGFRRRRSTCVQLLCTCTAQTPRLGLPTPPLGCLWLENIAWSDKSRFQLYQFDGREGYGENLMNPRTLYVNRWLFKLVKHLWWYGACEVGVWGPWCV